MSNSNFNTLAKTSFVLSELRSELEAWCASYIEAFMAWDAVAVSAHWAFPALTTQAGRSFVFKSEEHFAKNTQRLLDFYKSQNVARVERIVVDTLKLSETVVSLTVSDCMLSEDGTLIAAWQAAYVMQRRDSIWKAIAAIADGEVAAWAARGTPLGS